MENIFQLWCVTTRISGKVHIRSASEHPAEISASLRTANCLLAYICFNEKIRRSYKCNTLPPSLCFQQHCYTCNAHDQSATVTAAYTTTC